MMLINYLFGSLLFIYNCILTFSETNTRLKSSIAIPVPVRVAPYPTSRPLRTTPSPLTSPATSLASPHTRHSSSEESTISSSSLPYPKYSPFGEFPLYRKEFLLEDRSPNKKSAFQQVSPDANADLLRAKLRGLFFCLNRFLKKTKV